MIYHRIKDALAFNILNSQLIVSAPAIIMCHLSKPEFPL